MINVGVIGFGYWGPNIVRNFSGCSDARVVTVCDQRPTALQKATKAFPSIRVTTNPQEVITSSDVDAVAVVTPVWTHFELTKSALCNGKHVFVEKPFTSTTAQAEELIEIADRKHLQIMVDHTFLFTAAVQKIHHYIESGALGRLYYYDSTRANLGLFQHDVNVIWDLAPHDLSIVDYLLKDKPEAVIATAEQHFNGLEDLAFITLYFPNKVIAHINVNWLSPVKVRTTLIGGEKKMLVWDDIEPDEKIRIYDKGVEHVEDREGIYKLLVKYRTGDMLAPHLEHIEALSSEVAYFIDCLAVNKKPINDGGAGLRVVRILEAADRSVKQRGALVDLWMPSYA
ncbi:MAG: Gfo/Idh/MocA family oxidoreductase [Terriglobia bacterium]|jgi:predicted dehydrogenase|nr:Gfo/Idh/MocA family oxidoreductase [Terriglobia bacterium]